MLGTKNMRIEPEYRRSGVPGGSERRKYLRVCPVQMLDETAKVIEGQVHILSSVSTQYAVQLLSAP